MASQEQRDAVQEIANEISMLLANAIERHGILTVLGGLVSSAAALVADLDRDPETRALAAWTRTFSMAYDAQLYRSTMPTVGEA